ncbi:MAG: hypothetical protein WAN30_02200 [Acidimicrobiales bacterium]
MEAAKGPDFDAPPSSRSRRFTGAASVRAHCTLLAGLALCAFAFWFELGRAERGNELSWAYVFEWPLLGVFAIYMWWNVLDPERQSRVKRRRAKELAPEFHGMLDAWQEHQRALTEENLRRDQTSEPWTSSDRAEGS